MSSSQSCCSGIVPLSWILFKVFWNRLVGYLISCIGYTLHQYDYTVTKIICNYSEEKKNEEKRARKTSTKKGKASEEEETVRTKKERTAGKTTTWKEVRITTSTTNKTW